MPASAIDSARDGGLDAPADDAQEKGVPRDGRSPLIISRRHITYFLMRLPMDMSGGKARAMARGRASTSRPRDA